MSSILKALKRIEEQKTVRRDVSHDMEWVGGDGTGRPEAKRRWPTVAALAAVALVSVVSTYWLTQRAGDRRQTVSPAGQDAMPRPARPFSTPAAPPPGEVPREMLIRPAAPTVPRPSAVAPVSPRETREVPTLDGDADAPEIAAAPPRPEPRKAVRQTGAPRPAELPQAQPAAAAASPRFNVTGIAWQGEGQVHLAVVNGQSVTEGSIVDGARVERISPDKVSFSFRNRTFDVPLGESSGVP